MTGYQNILQGALISDNPSGVPITLTLNNLVAGRTYQLELWSTSSYSKISGGTATDETTALGGTSFTIDGGVTQLGQYAVITFDADNTPDAVTISADCDSVLNAYSLIEEAAAVPEPSTVALLSAGAGLLGLVAIRRFRLASA